MLRANQLHHQRGTGRVKQRAADTGEEAGEPEQPGLVGNGHRGKACRAEQHTGHDHWFSAKAVSDRAAKDAQTLLDKLTQSQGNTDHYRRPAHLIDKADRDEREHDKKAEHDQHVID